MRCGNLFASILMACLLAAGLAGLAPAAKAAPAGQSLLTRGDSAATHFTEIGYRRRGPRVVFPIAPSYLAHDYPYYYSRGYYPRHIGPGYIYHYPVFHRPAYSARYGGRCAKWHRKCAANWGHRTGDYDGCMDYHRCD
jgi:hypothetical protein